MKKKPSFANRILDVVRFSFGITFIVIFVGTAVLLYFTEKQYHVYLIKLFSLLIVYVATFLCLNRILTRKIIQIFLPLDRFAKGIITDEIAIYGTDKDFDLFIREVSQDIERLNDVTSELEETKLRFKDVVKSKNHYQRNVNDFISTQKNDYYLLYDKQNLFKNCTKELNKQLEGLYETISSVSYDNDNVYSDYNQISEGIAAITENFNDLTTNIIHNENSTNCILRQLDEVIVTLEGFYTDLTSLNSTCQQINLYTMNTSLEISRQGLMSLSISTAIEEIMRMSDKTIASTDSMALATIKAKNQLEVIRNQAEGTQDNSKDAALIAKGLAEKLNSLKVTIESSFDATIYINSKMNYLKANAIDLINTSKCMCDENNEVSHLIKKALDDIHSNFKNKI